ncbi:MAG TPA: bacillithiol biosynthesis BshC [Candidatus Krumholzibacteria bacterium]|nr:bacillithiol biosynthesis BshC [Candidatus Krumholzibacteria bacterium]
MTLSTIPVHELPGASALYRDFVQKTGARIHARLGDFRVRDESWKRALASGGPVDPRLVDRIVSYSAELGAGERVLETARGLADASARAVITGQQPGVAGGPLLSLYKAATAVALAREVTSRWGTPCVPIFWLGSDDDDFTEIRELNVISSALEVVSVSLDASVYAPGRRVGDIDGSAALQAWDAVASFLPSEENARAVREWFREGDLGRTAARSIVALTGGNLIVVDGREPLLRDAARDTLLEFFDQEDAIRDLVRGEGEALEADGYHAQLELGADSGLFVVAGGVRQRIPRDARPAAREAFERDIRLATPGVVARTVVQDAVFHPAAVVLGPAEIAYRAQLTRVYDLLRIPRPVVFPRLSATFVPPPVKAASEVCGTDPALLATDPPQWVARTTEAAGDRRVADAARTLEDEFRAMADAFAAMASARLDARAKEKLERRMADMIARVRAAAQAAVEQDALAGAVRWPWLANAVEMWVRNGEVQERFLAATVPFSFHGDAAVSMVEAEAGAHVAGALDGQVLHRVYSP